MSLGRAKAGGSQHCPWPVPWRHRAALVVTRLGGLGGFHGEEKLGRVLSSSVMGTGAGKWVTRVTWKPRDASRGTVTARTEAGKVNVRGMKCNRAAPAGPVPRARTLPRPRGVRRVRAGLPRPRAASRSLCACASGRGAARCPKNTQRGAHEGTRGTSESTVLRSDLRTCFPSAQRRRQRGQARDRRAEAPGGTDPRGPASRACARARAPHGRFQSDSQTQGRSCGRESAFGGQVGRLVFPPRGCRVELPLAHLSRAKGPRRAPEERPPKPAARGWGPQAPQPLRRWRPPRGARDGSDGRFFMTGLIS